MKREQSCCFTGHRPDKLPWGENESDPRCLALKRRLEEEDTQEGVHIGLLNTHKRLELIYGGDYKIRLLSRPGRGTMIELKIRALPWDGHGGGTLSGRQSGAVQTDRKKSPD